MTLAWYDNRIRLHNSSDVGLKKKATYEAPGRTLKEGQFRHLSRPVRDYGDRPHPTHIFLRDGEARGFILFRSTMKHAGQVES